MISTGEILEHTYYCDNYYGTPKSELERLSSAGRDVILEIDVNGAMQVKKLFPDITVNGVACPFWVPLVEYNEADSPGADYFVKKRIDQLMRLDPQIDAVILGCTHYPLLMPKILKYIHPGVRIVPQGEYVAESLKNYFDRHPEIEQKCSKGGQAHYLTTESTERFKEQAQLFLHEPVEVENITLG